MSRNPRRHRRSPLRDLPMCCLVRIKPWMQRSTGLRKRSCCRDLRAAFQPKPPAQAATKAKRLGTAGTAVCFPATIDKQTANDFEPRLGNQTGAFCLRSEQVSSRKSCADWRELPIGISEGMIAVMQVTKERTYGRSDRYGWQWRHAPRV